MWSLLAAPEFRPFAIAACVLVGVLVIEVASILLGASVSALLDSVFGLHGAHLDAPGHAGPEGTGHAPHTPLASAFDWLNAGRVPLLVLMMIATACFAVSGMLVQILAARVVAPLPVSVAALVAIVAAIPATRRISRLVARIVPRDETYVLADQDLVGRVGIVTLGPVAEGAAARAKVQDSYGNWHFPRVAPGAPGLSIPAGARILIVEKVGGHYTVIAAEGRLAPAQD